jgi:hypothetical protein
MKQNNLNWFSSSFWCKGHAALDENSKPVVFYSKDAKYLDLSSAIKLGYDESKVPEIFSRIRSIIKMLYPDIYAKKSLEFKKKCPTYRKRDFCPLYMLNDELESLDVARILFYL